MLVFDPVPPSPDMTFHAPVSTIAFAEPQLAVPVHAGLVTNDSMGAALAAKHTSS